MATTDNPYANLTPEQILQLLQSGNMGNGQVSAAYASGVGGGQDGMSGPVGTQYNVWDGQGYHPGQMNYSYDGAGNYIGSHSSVDPKQIDKLALLSAAALAGGVGMFGGMGSAGAGGTLGEGWAGGAAGGGFSGAGTMAGSAAALDPSLAVQGNSINALDAATGVPYGSNLATAGSGLTDGASLFGDPGNFANPLTNPVTSADLVKMGGGLIPAGASSLLGPAVAAIGAAAGSKGVQQSQTQTHELPPEMKPYVYGTGGLLDSANQLFKQQISPAAQAGWQQMQGAGLGLLNQPVAGNGFQQFMARPRFGMGG